MGPLGVILESFRVDGNFEWVVRTLGFLDTLERCPKTPQNSLFDGFSAQITSLAADLALVAIFSLLAGCPKIFLFEGIWVQIAPFAADLTLVAIFSALAGCPNPAPRIAFSTRFRPRLFHLLKIWPGGNFQPLGWVPQNLPRITISMGFPPRLPHLLQIWPWWQFSASWLGAPKPLPE